MAWRVVLFVGVLAAVVIGGVGTWRDANPDSSCARVFDVNGENSHRECGFVAGPVGQARA